MRKIQINAKIRPARHRRYRKEWWTVLFLFVLAVPWGSSQWPQGRASGGAASNGLGMGADPAQREEGPEAEKRLRALNAERQKELVADTNKLLKLASELDAEVARSDSANLTPAQLHKVAEIEKLAHSVREKMATSVRSIPVFHEPFSVPPIS